MVAPSSLAVSVSLVASFIAVAVVERVFVGQHSSDSSGNQQTETKTEP